MPTPSDLQPDPPPGPEGPGPVGVIDVVLFDLGNVVFNVDFQRVFAHWSASSGVPAATIGPAFVADKDANRHFEVGAWTPEAFHRHCNARLALGIAQDSFEAGWNNIFGPATPGIDHLLDALAPRARLAVFSNTNHLHERAFSRIYAGTLARFSRIYTSHVLARAKPDPAAFTAVASDLGVAPGRILFFDDTVANIAGARSAGLHACHWRGLSDGVRAAHAHGLLTAAESESLLAVG